MSELSRSDLSRCRATLSAGSRTFLAASLLLPRPVRDAATALYAFCRLADDAVDLEGGRLDAVARLQERLDRTYAGRPASDPVDRAFAAVVHDLAIPRALPEALLEGLAWDAEGRRYRDQSGLIAYATRVAGAVGAMMALVMGARRREVLARAIDLGIAMQLTNIARDVGEDARAGRLYLPSSWLSATGLDPESWLREPVHSPALATVVRRLLTLAETFYGRADSAIPCLPPACRPGIRAARLLYAEIGREVERQGLDSIRGRAVVPRARKARLLPSAVVGRAFRGEVDPAPVVPEAAFLLDEVIGVNQSFSHEKNGLQIFPDWRLKHQAVWLIGLFDRLERQDRMAQGRLEGAWRRS
jgi:phytoene synthase